MSTIDSFIRSLNEQFKDMGLSVCLAGGAVRDMVAGVKPKDYDFLVLGKEWLYDVLLEAKIRSLADTDTPVLTKGKAGYNDNHRCGDVYEFEYAGRKVNLIFPNLSGDVPWATPQEALEHFDTTLNLYWYDFEARKIHIDNRASCNTLKVGFVSHPDEVGPQRTAKRYQRLQPRYPELDWSAIEKYLDDTGWLSWAKGEVGCTPEQEPFPIFPLGAV